MARVIASDPNPRNGRDAADSAALASLMRTALRFRTILLIIVVVCQAIRWISISPTVSSSPTTVPHIPDTDDLLATVLNHAHYDSSMQMMVYHVQKESECKLSPLQHAIVECLSGLNHWDGKQSPEHQIHLKMSVLYSVFHRIQVLAELLMPCLSLPGIHMLQISLLGGHEIEKETAFFPGMPLVVKFIGAMLQQVWPPLCTITATLIAAFILSQICFVVNIALVYTVSRVYFSSGFAFDATLCFLFNPASIFLLANYTESSFFMLLLIGFLCRARGLTLLSCIAFGMSSLIRSTGWLCVGFVIFDVLTDKDVQAFVQSFGAAQSQSKEQQRNWKRLIVQVVQTIVYVVVIVAPYICLQLHFARRFCSDEHIEARPQYCSSLFPHVYSHVQERYWNVGLFRYYELKQIPNFIFALPVWSLSFYSLYQYFRYDASRFMTLGFSCHQPVEKKNEKIPRSSDNPNASKGILIFMYWWCALLFICITILHVQVSTRFLSSCLPIYWFAADVMHGGGRAANLLTLWAASFIVVGTTLFASFLPWT